MTKPVVFRIHPDRSSRFVRVVFHPSCSAMIKHVCAVHGRSGVHKSAVGLCVGFSSGRCVSEVHLSRTRMGIAVVSHELFHATIHWGRRLGLRFWAMSEGSTDPSRSTEERLAYIHDEIFRQFVSRAYDLGLYS